MELLGFPYALLTNLSTLSMHLKYLTAGFMGYLRKNMKLGNIMAALGLVSIFLGLLMLPLYNFKELPFLADTGYAKGGGWKLMAQSGVFKWPGLYFIIAGIFFTIISWIIPRKYWETTEDLFEKEFEEGRKKKQ